MPSFFTYAPKRGQSALAVLLCTLGSAAFAADFPLTLQEATRLSVERSRLVVAKDFAVQASQDMAVAAARLPDPVLSAGIENVPIDGPNQFSTTRESMTMRRIGVMQELTRPDKRRLRAERYEREAEQSAAEKAAVIAAIEREAALAWLERSYAESMAATVAEQAAQAAQEIEAAQAAYRGGRGTQADVVNAQSAQAAIADRASEIRRRIANAGINLARRVGDAAQRPLANPPALDAIALDPAALPALLAQHPDIAVLSMREAISETQARLAQANRKPDWTVELAYKQRGDAYSNMLSVGVSVPLQWDRKNRQDRELSARLAEVEQAKAERDDALLDRVAEVTALINDWHISRERYARYQRELVPLAQSLTQAQLAAYRGGKAALGEVLAARSAELAVRLEALSLAAGSAQLWARLNYLFPHISAHAKAIK